jgi:antitoxin CptB
VTSISNSGGSAAPAAGGVDRDGARMRRLRWRSRRGLLENDIVLGRFLDARAGRDLTEDEIRGLDILLDLTDPELLDLVLGRAEPSGEAACRAAQAVLRALRAA